MGYKFTVVRDMSQRKDKHGIQVHSCERYESEGDRHVKEEKRVRIVTGR